MGINNKYNVEDYIGKKFGKRTIIADAGKNKKSACMVRCRCECGREDIVLLSYLTHGKSFTCPDCKSGHKPIYLEKDFIGKEFNGKKVLACYKDSTGKRMATVECTNCGKVMDVLFYELTRKKGKYPHKWCKYCSPGAFKHGSKTSKLYEVWCSIKDRCKNPNCKGYVNYGGRGISICKEWDEDYTIFRDWAYANGYIEGVRLTIDRIDVNGNYEPSNCRWATYTEQNSCHKRIRKDNVSGYTGVKPTHNKRKWIAVIRINKKDYHLGTYCTKKEALEVRNKYIKDNNLPHDIQEYNGE